MNDDDNPRREQVISAVLWQNYEIRLDYKLGSW